MEPKKFNTEKFVDVFTPYHDVSTIVAHFFSFVCFLLALACCMVIYVMLGTYLRFLTFYLVRRTHIPYTVLLQLEHDVNLSSCWMSCI